MKGIPFVEADWFVSVHDLPEKFSRQDPVCRCCFHRAMPANPEVLRHEAAGSTDIDVPLHIERH